MNAFRNILVATDFGVSSTRAVDLAVELAREQGAALTLVHALERFIPPYPVPLAPEPGTFERAARAELAKEAARIGERFPAAKHVFLEGEPARAIVRYAADHAVDLVVLGTHGRRGAVRWLLGSVAERVLRTSPVPVMTVRAEGAPSE